MRNMSSLINTCRLRDSTGKSNLTDKQKIESDRGRVIFSPPLRRMQSKAQVFSLESNAAVRSRLTHSLEVAHIGRYIVQKLQQISDQHENDKFKEAFILAETIVETACLLHDIGNPPFGHLGEAAIKEWFTENSPELYSHAMNPKNHVKAGCDSQECKAFNIDCNSQEYKDLENFDGNPQGLRIVMTLQGEPGQKGLNLTHSQIASIVKYPRLSNDNLPYDKIGAFVSEQDDLLSIWKELKLDIGERFPLVYLMEAADDIAYSLGDIEDGIEKGIKTEKNVMLELRNVFKDKEITNFDHFFSSSSESSILKEFISFRISMINNLVETAATCFYERLQQNSFGIESIFHKKFDHTGVSQSQAIKAINGYCAQHFYASSEAVDIEIAGYEIVHGLLNKFSILLKVPRAEFEILVTKGKGKDLTRRVFSKLPKSLVEHYTYSSRDKSDNTEWYNRVRLVVDYISGMTDDYALKAYKLFNGIEIKVL